MNHQEVGFLGIVRFAAGGLRSYGLQIELNGFSVLIRQASDQPNSHFQFSVLVGLGVLVYVCKLITFHYSDSVLGSRAHA